MASESDKPVWLAGLSFFLASEASIKDAGSVSRSPDGELVTPANGLR